jgi:hypothetical protein
VRRTPIPRALAIVGLTLLAGACAHDDPPDFLRSLGPTTTLAPTTTTTAATPTTSTGSPASPASTTGTGGTGGTTTSTAPPSETPVTDLTLGDCVSGPAFRGDAPGEATQAQLSACDVVHDGEVVGVVTYNDGPSAAYPGQDQVAAHADTQCAAAFGGYVGTAYGHGPLSMVALWPTADSWAGGDRQAVCVAVKRSGQLTASVKATG